MATRLLRSFTYFSSSTRIPSISNALRYCLPSTESFAFRKDKHESFVPCQRFSTSILTPGADENEYPRHMLSNKPVVTLEGEIGLKKDKLIPVTNFQNEDKGMIVLPGDVFDVPIRKDIVQRVVRWQLAKRQQGTHSTKTISEVSGTGRKPWPQKGTGRARHGTLRSNQFRGGAIMHGPKPRSHAISS